MTTFDERERAFENKYAHEQQIDFNIEAKQSKLYGLWAAERLELDDDLAERYSDDVVLLNANSNSFQTIVHKVQGDLKEKGLDISNHMMEVQLQRCLSLATSEIMGQNQPETVDFG